MAFVSTGMGGNCGNCLIKLRKLSAKHMETVETIHIREEHICIYLFYFKDSTDTM